MPFRTSKHKLNEKKFSSKWHSINACRDIVDMMSKGDSRAKFCSVWNISQRLFDYWVAKYPEFSEAYERGQAAYQSWWEEEGKQGMWQTDEVKFNERVWKELGMRTIGAPKGRTINIKDLEVARTPMERFEVVIRSLASGELSIEEARTISSILAEGVKIEDATEMKLQLEAVIEAMEAQGVSINQASFTESKGAGDTADKAAV